MAEEKDEHRTFREQVAQEHEERLTGYRALLARLESVAADAQMAADDVTTNTASQFTDDLRFVIGLTEELVKRFRHSHQTDDTPQ